MATFKRAKAIKPKETTSTAAINSTKNFDKAMKKGHSRVTIINEQQTKKIEALKNKETKKATLDYIFGKTDENPLDNINKSIDKKIQNIDKKINIKNLNEVESVKITAGATEVNRVTDEIKE